MNEAKDQGALERRIYMFVRFFGGNWKKHAKKTKTRGDSGFPRILLEQPECWWAYPSATGAPRGIPGTSGFAVSGQHCHPAPAPRGSPQFIDRLFDIRWLHNMYASHGLYMSLSMLKMNDYLCGTVWANIHVHLKSDPWHMEISPKIEIRYNHPCIGAGELLAQVMCKRQQIDSAIGSPKHLAWQEGHSLKVSSCLMALGIQKKTKIPQLVINPWHHMFTSPVSKLTEQNVPLCSRNHRTIQKPPRKVRLKRCNRATVSGPQRRRTSASGMSVAQPALRPEVHLTAGSLWGNMLKSTWANSTRMKKYYSLGGDSGHLDVYFQCAGKKYHCECDIQGWKHQWMLHVVDKNTMKWCLDAVKGCFATRSTAGSVTFKFFRVNPRTSCMKIGQEGAQQAVKRRLWKPGLDITWHRPMRRGSSRVVFLHVLESQESSSQIGC